MLQAATPEITMTLGELMEAEDALTHLLELKLPVKLAYHVAKIARLVKVETTHFKTERDNFVKEFGEPDKDANGQEMIRVKPDRIADYMAKVIELSKVEASIAWKPLKLGDLTEITGQDILRLGALLTDDE